MITHEDSIKLAKELDLPQELQKAVKGEKPVGDLWIFFGCPKGFYMMSHSEQEVYGQHNIIPLWDDGNFGFIVGYHREKKKYVRFHIEDGCYSENTFYMNWQQIMFQEFVSLYDSEMENEEFLSLAKEFRFKHADIILDAYINDDFHGLQHSEWTSKMTRSLDS